MFRLPLSIRRFKPKHMATFIIWLRVWSSVLATGHVDYVVILSTPGGTRWIPGGKGNVFQVPALGTEHHDTIGVEHGNPQISVGAGLLAWMSVLQVCDSLLHDHSIWLTKGITTIDQ